MHVTYKIANTYSEFQLCSNFLYVVVFHGNYALPGRAHANYTTWITMRFRNHINALHETVLPHKNVGFLKSHTIQKIQMQLKLTVTILNSIYRENNDLVVHETATVVIVNFPHSNNTYFNLGNTDIQYGLWNVKTRTYPQTNSPFPLILQSTLQQVCET